MNVDNYTIGTGSRYPHEPVPIFHTQWLTKCRVGLYPSKRYAIPLPFSFRCMKFHFFIVPLLYPKRPFAATYK